MLKDLSAGFVELKREECIDTIKERIEKSEDPLKILEDARKAMTAVGDKFQEGNPYLAEMLLAAEIFNNAVELLKPHLKEASPGDAIGKIVIATPKGDIHDLGKNIFVTLLEGQGFEVFDLGVDVDSSMIVNKVREVKPDLVGFSALITTAFASMKQLAEIFVEENLRDDFKLMVGGGVTNPTLNDHLSADFQTTDAMEGVSYCLKVMSEKV
jgi:methanogenic corrinoid protein MtbC1